LGFRINDYLVTTIVVDLTPFDEEFADLETGV